MANNIQLRKQYATMLDLVYKKASLTSILDGAASASEDPEMDELCEALEKMARMELHAYATGQK